LPIGTAGPGQHQRPQAGLRHRFPFPPAAGPSVVAMVVATVVVGQSVVAVAVGPMAVVATSPGVSLLSGAGVLLLWSFS